MSSSTEYPDVALEHVQSQGWNTNITEVQEGTSIIEAEQEDDSGSKKMLLMVVYNPETEVTTEHVRYLIKTAKQRNISNGGLTADVPVADDAKQAIEENNISYIDIENHQQQQQEDDKIELTQRERVKFSLAAIIALCSGLFLFFINIEPSDVGRRWQFWVRIPFLLEILGLAMIYNGSKSAYISFTGKAKESVYQRTKFI